MLQRKVQFATVQDIERFSQIVGKYPFDVELNQEPCFLNGKSLMSGLCLQLSTPVTMVLRTEDDQGLLEEIKEYLV